MLSELSGKGCAAPGGRLLKGEKNEFDPDKEVKYRGT
jgi:hypothetical protein